MAQRRGRKPKTIPMTVGQDPSLWRFANVQEALVSSADVIAQLIHSGEDAAEESLFDEGTSEGSNSGGSD